MFDINKTQAKYLVLDLTTFEMREEENGPMEDFDILRNITCRTTEMWFRRIEPGTFMMGCPNNELGYMPTETQHKVTISKPFYVGVFQVTQKQYGLIVGENPSLFKDDICPVECVTYDMLRGSDKGANWPADNDVDDYSFLGKLKANVNVRFDLPTEAQWEYACRAGTATAWNNGKNITSNRDDPELDKLGCYAGNGTTHAPVGCFLPNAWGIYDMHGNVWEWCLDWVDIFENESATDPKGPQSGDWRVVRGGSVGNDAARCRAASRYLNASDKASYLIGFRLVINLDIIAVSRKKTANESRNHIASTERLADFNVLKSTQSKYLVLNLQTYEMREEDNGPMEDSAILKNDTCKTTELWLRRIEPGTFMMGSRKDGIPSWYHQTQHKVTLTQPFYIGVFQVTQMQYKLITGDTPSHFKGKTRPVDSVSYSMIRGSEKGANWPANNEVDEGSFLGILRSNTKMTFDLPTDAQWEYACRAGTTTSWNNGKNLTDTDADPELNKLGRNSNSIWLAKILNKIGLDKLGDFFNAGHAPVGSYLPNAWGLYDMHGNIWEWCLDWFDDFQSYSVTDPKGPENGEDRVVRGGGWSSSAMFCCVDSRLLLNPNRANEHFGGFRVVLIP